MAYIKIGSSRNAAACLTYGECKNGKHRKDIVVDALNCSAETAKEEFALMRNLWGKNNGIQIHTIIQSFGEGEVTMQQANGIGIETAKRLFGEHQVVVYTHNDGIGSKIHNHIMVNAVNFETGKKIDNHGLLYEAREVSDEICRKRGLSVIPHDRETRTEKKLKTNGEKPWKDKLRDVLDRAKTDAKNLDDFKEILGGEGIKINERNSHKEEGGKAWTYVINRNDWDLKSGNIKIRGRTLGDDYTYAHMMRWYVTEKKTIPENIMPFTPKFQTDSYIHIPNHSFDLEEKEHQEREKSKKQYTQDLAKILSYCIPAGEGKDELYGIEFLKEIMPALEMIAKKDFAGAAQILYPDAMMRYVVNLHGTDSQILNDAVLAISEVENKPMAFTAKLLNATLNTKEYRNARKCGGRGAWSGLTHKLTADDDNLARLDLPAMKKEIDEWQYLSETEKADLQANNSFR